MNPQSSTLATSLATEIKQGLVRMSGPEVVIAPPTLFLEVVKRILGSTQSLTLGAQNAHHEKLGAHTGEISFLMLKNFGVHYVIIGHSERRETGESNLNVAQKIQAALKENISPIVCVGERDRDSEGNYLSFIEEEVRTAFASVSKTKLSKITIAYEPIWAIGTGVNATPEDAHEVKLFIQKTLSDMFGRNAARSVRILYGGSVNAKNASELMERGTVDGFLVGGSSLNADEFLKIVKTVQPYA